MAVGMDGLSVKLFVTLTCFHVIDTCHLLLNLWYNSSRSSPLEQDEDGLGDCESGEETEATDPGWRPGAGVAVAEDSVRAVPEVQPDQSALVLLTQGVEVHTDKSQARSDNNDTSDKPALHPALLTARASPNLLRPNSRQGSFGSVTPLSNLSSVVSSSRQGSGVLLPATYDKNTEAGKLMVALE